MASVSSSVSVSRLTVTVSVSPLVVMIVRLAMVSVVPMVSVALLPSVSRSAAIPVRPVMASVSSSVTVSRSAVTPVLPVTVSVSPLVVMIVRHVMVSVVPTVSVALLPSASRSAVTPVRPATVTVSSSTSASRLAGTTVPSVRPVRRAGTAPLPAPIARPSAGMTLRPLRVRVTPRIFAAPTVRTVSVRPRLMRTSPDRNWTRSPAPSCGTSKRSTVNGSPSTWSWRVA